MAILSRPKISPQQRFDLEDFQAGLAALRSDSLLWTKQVLSSNNRIFKGFSVSGIGLSQATVNMTDGTLIIPQSTVDFSYFISAPAEPNIVIPDADLTDGVRNYVELFLTTLDGVPLTKAFWDPEANGGLGAEFNQIVNTVTDIQMNVSVSTAGFSGDPDSIQLAIIDTDGSGVIKVILDQREIFGRLGLPSDIDNEYSWGTKQEPAYSLTMTGVAGTFIAGEEISIGSETATVVTGGTTAITFNVPSGISFSNGDAVVGADSGATGTVNTVLEAFGGVDKSLGNFETIVKALQTEIKRIKGTRFWYDDAEHSLNGVTHFLDSVMVQAVVDAKYAWDGNNLSITDDDLTPANADILAYLRQFGKSGDIALTRQDGTGGSVVIPIAEGEVLFIKVPTSGSRTFSGIGSGDTNYQVADIADFENDDENYWMAYRENGLIYIRGIGELEAGEDTPISDPDKETILALIAASTARANQDRNSKLVEGGTWSLNFDGDELTLSADAYIQVSGIEKDRNTISAQAISLPNPTSLAYVTIDRDAGVPVLLSVSVADSDAVVLGNNTYVIARRVDDGVVVGESFLLKPTEYLELDGALAEINRYFGSLKLSEHETDVDRARISESQVAQLDGNLLEKIVGGTFLLDFDGAVVDFTSGDVYESDGVTPLGTNFTPFSIPVGQYFWYGISVIPDTVGADNTQSGLVQVDPATAANASASLAPKPNISGEIPLGAIQIFNNAGNLEIFAIRRLAVGSGSGSSRSIKADFLDPVSTTLPVGVSVTIDGVSGVNDDLVLFTNLSSNNNRIYKLGGVGVSLTWTAQRAFNNSFDPTDGDSVRIQRGDAFQDQLAVFNDTDFLVNDVIRLFDGVSGDFWELGSIKTSGLTDNTTDTLFSIAYAGSENIIVDYSIIRGLTKETGQLFITTDGSTVAVTKSNAYLGDAGVEFSGSIAGPLLEINYTTDASGSAGTMKYFLKRWSDSPGGPTGVPSYSGGGSGGAAGGSNAEIQYNNAGLLDGDPNFQVDTSLGALNLNGLRIGALSAGVTLNDNQVAPALAFQYAHSFRFAVIEYSIQRGTDYRVGRLLVPNNGTIVSISDDQVETGATGVVFSATISGANLNINYTSTSTGQTATLKYSIRRWS